MAVHPSLLQQFALMRLFPADALAQLAAHSSTLAFAKPLKYSRTMIKQIAWMAFGALLLISWLIIMLNIIHLANFGLP